MILALFIIFKSLLLQRPSNLSLFRDCLLQRCFVFPIFAIIKKMLHVMAMVNSDAVNIGVHASFWIKVFSRKMPRSRPYGHRIFCFLRSCHRVHHIGGTNLDAFWQCKRVPCSQRSLQIIVCRVFDEGYLDWCEVIPHCSFDLHFSGN